MFKAALNTQNRKQEHYASQHNNDYGNCITGFIFFIAVLCTIFIIGWMVLNWMEDAQRLPLSKLKLVVTGDRNYTSNNDIRKAIIALVAPGTFMTQDVNIIKKQIEDISWIKHAKIRKQWPDELQIHLVEYKPVAFWNDKYLVDVDGKVFFVPVDRVTSKHKHELPMLYGPEGCEIEVLQGFKDMCKVLAKYKDLFTLKKAVMTARRSWLLTLTNGIKLNVGRGDTMTRLARFLELYPILIQQTKIYCTQIQYVDLRYNSGAAVAWLHQNSR